MGGAAGFRQLHPVFSCSLDQGILLAHDFMSAQEARMRRETGKE